MTEKKEKVIRENVFDFEGNFVGWFDRVPSLPMRN